MDTAKEKVNKLTKENPVVFWGGVNDVSKNNSPKGLNQTMDFVRRNQQTNIILINFPHKFDLDNLSGVNKEVKVYHRKLNKRVNHFHRITLVSAAPEKSLFIRHGLHMNVRGKEAMSRILAVIINEIVDKHKICNPIAMMWKDDLTRGKKLMYQM
jgi:hypothetical protein